MVLILQYIIDLSYIENCLIRSEDLQSSNIERHPYSPHYSAKKYDEPEVQRCKEISQKHFPRQKNSETMIQESSHVGENLASSTKCKKNENSDNPKDTNDADLHLCLNTGGHL